MFVVKKLSLGDLWPMLFMTVIGVGLIRFPFQILVDRDDPIDNVSEVLIASAVFVFFISFGVYSIWAVISLLVSEILASFKWGYINEGMRKEDVLHILGEAAWKDKFLCVSTGERWFYRYPWFRLSGYIIFGANNTVSYIQLPEGEPENPY